MGTGATSHVKSTVTNVKNGVHDVSPSTVNVVEHAPVVKGKHSFTLDISLKLKYTITHWRNIFGDVT